MIYDLSHGRTALLVIDVQREYFDPDGPAFVEHAADIVANVNLLIDAFRAHRLPIVFMKHEHRADGSDAGRMGDFSAPDEEDSFVAGTPRVELIPELRVRPDDIVVVKRRYSSFLGTDLEAILHTAATTRCCSWPTPTRVPTSRTQRERPCLTTSCWPAPRPRWAPASPRSSRAPRSLPALGRRETAGATATDWAATSRPSRTGLRGSSGPLCGPLPWR